MDQLVEKLRGFERSNEDIITALAGSNREIRTLTEEIYYEKKPGMSESRNSRQSARSSVHEDDGTEHMRAHYEEEVQQLNELKKREEYIFT